MQLFDKSTLTECLVWQCSCSHFSGLIILLANMLIDPDHDIVSVDQDIALRAIQLFDKIIDLVPSDSDSIRKFRLIVGDLYDRALDAVTMVGRQRRTDGNTIQQSFGVDPFRISPEQWITESISVDDLLQANVPY